MTANSLSFWPSAAATVSTWHRFCAPCSGYGPSGSVCGPGVGEVERRPGLGEGIDISSARRFCIVDTVFCQAEVTADLRVARERP